MSLIFLTCKLLEDVKTLHERLTQNPHNGSIPLSSRVPWMESADNDDGDEDKSESKKLKRLTTKQSASENDSEDTADDEQPGDDRAGSKKGDKKKKPGKQPEVPGVGRTQALSITGTIIHKAESCSGCSAALNEEDPF